MPSHRRRPASFLSRSIASWLVIGAALATACGTDSSVTTAPTQVKCQVTLAAENASMGADGGTGSVAVTTTPECPWDVTTSAAWVSNVTPTSGQGNGTVSFRVAPNPQPAAREGDIVINDNHLRVAQQPAPCRYALSPAAVTVPATGGSATVSVAAMSGCGWNVAVDAPWVSLSSPSGNGAGTVGLTVAANPSPEPRTAVIALGDERVTITQGGASTDPGPCALAIAPSSQSFPTSGGPATIAVSANAGCTWSAASTVPWATITGGASGSGSGAIGVLVAANTGAARTGLVRIGDQTFSMAQSAAGPSCVYSLDAPGTSVPAAGGPGTITVASASGCAWTANSSVPWLTVTAGASGSGAGTVSFTVAANTAAARSGTIAVAGQTYTVSQAAGTQQCSFAVAPTSASVADTASSGAVTVTTSSGCAWTAVSAVPWVTVTAGGSGSGGGSVAYEVAANTGPARSGTLTVAGQTVTISQAAAPAPCSYALTPTSASVADTASAGTIAVATTSACAWTASSGASWLTITGGGSGTGAGSVSYAVAANTGAARTGSLTVAGQTFAVTQAAAPPPPPACTYSISPSSVTISGKKGSGSVAVTTASSCAWTAVAKVGWIVITSGASGTGSGTVTFDLTSKPGKNTRTGTITVAGQTFTVTQKD